MWEFHLDGICLIIVLLNSNLCKVPLKEDYVFDLDEKMRKNAFFLEKISGIFCYSLKKLYLCIAIEKTMAP